LGLGFLVDDAMSEVCFGCFSMTSSASPMSQLCDSANEPILWLKVLLDSRLES